MLLDAFDCPREAYLDGSLLLWGFRMASASSFKPYESAVCYPKPLGVVRLELVLR